MAYFPNGSAGDYYEARYCSKCINHRDNIPGSGSEGCFVMDLHLLWSYEAANGEEAPKDSKTHIQWLALEHFIPSRNDGFPDQCRMFVPKESVEIVVDKTQALKEWEVIYGKRAE